MDRNTAINVFDSLASGLRLDIYRLLVKQGEAGMVAGAIAKNLDMPASNLSFHLKALVQAGLLTVTQEGRYQRYRADMLLMTGLIDYLTEECCAGHPEQCVDLPRGTRANESQK